VEQSPGIYLYCFARPGAVHGLEAAGVDDRLAISTLEVGGVAAVFSEVSLTEFCDDNPADARPDPNWIISRAYRHERLIEEVMSRSPVLPVRFGAVFSSRETLEKLLTDRCREIEGFLGDIAGKEEWAVKGFVDNGKAEEWLLESDSDLLAQRRSLSTSPGTRYFQEKQFRAGLQKQVTLWGRTVAEQVRQHLKNLAVEMRSLRLQPPRLSGRTGEMVLNYALLLPRSRVADFRARVEALATRYAEQGLSLEYSGPWPSFNFCPSLEETKA
jgi:hypothetical protein